MVWAINYHAFCQNTHLWYLRRLVNKIRGIKRFWLVMAQSPQLLSCCLVLGTNSVQQDLVLDLVPRFRDPVTGFGERRIQCAELASRTVGYHGRDVFLSARRLCPSEAAWCWDLNWPRERTVTPALAVHHLISLWHCVKRGLEWLSSAMAWFFLLYLLVIVVPAIDSTTGGSVLSRFLENSKRSQTIQ